MPSLSQPSSAPIPRIALDGHVESGWTEWNRRSMRLSRSSFLCGEGPELFLPERCPGDPPAALGCLGEQYPGTSGLPGVATNLRDNLRRFRKARHALCGRGIDGSVSCVPALCTYGRMKGIVPPTSDPEFMQQLRK